MNDNKAMAKVWEMAKKCEPPYQFGAAVVKDGVVIGLDHNHVKEAPDTSAHAEVSAIRKACQSVGCYTLKGCTLYTTHEPCIMCFACAMWADIERVVYQVPKSVQDSLMYASSMNINEFNATALRSNIVIQKFNN